MARQYYRSPAKTTKTAPNNEVAQPTLPSNNVSVFTGLISVITGCGILYGAPIFFHQLASQPIPTPQTEQPVLKGASPIPASQLLYEKVNPAVVMIKTNHGQGSGAIIDPTGIIVTNRHVVDDNKEVRVEISSGETYTGKVIESTSNVDLAVIHITTNHALPCIHLSTAPVSIGQPVYALGNPLGLKSTFTNGIVSHLDKNGDVMHTAAIAPGSSGSPLLDERGNAIAINQAVRRDLSVGVAIPASTVASLISTSTTCPSN
jgi:S1-C subfamily serine protease